MKKIRNQKHESLDRAEEPTNEESLRRVKRSEAAKKAWVTIRSKSMKSERRQTENERDTATSENQSADNSKGGTRQLAKQHQMEPNDQLYDAAYAGDLDGAMAAIAAGADDHITGDSFFYSNPVVTAAAQSGNAKLVEFLLKSGAKQESYDVEGIGTAIVSGNVRMVKAFLKYWSFNESEYLELLKCATREKHEEVGKLLLPHCGNGSEKERFLEFKKEQTLKRRVDRAVSKANLIMQAAPPSPPRKWRIEPDGIYVDGPPDAVLGRGFRELNAKGLSPGWRISLKHAGAVAELLRNYPQLEAQRRELFRPARECLEKVQMPTGYKIIFCHWHLKIRGYGNAALDARLTSLFDAGYKFTNGQTTWTVSTKMAAELANALQLYPPAPEPPPVTESEASGALEGAQMPVGYTCQVCWEGVIVKGPYLKDLVKQLRAVNGTWDPAAKQWTVPLWQVTGLVEALRRSCPDSARIAEASAALTGVTAPEGYNYQVCQDGIYVCVPETDGLCAVFNRLEAWWDDASSRWYLLPEHAGALRDLFLRFPVQAAEAKRILVSTPMPKGYTCQISSACIYVSGPKDERLRKCFNKLEGRWHPEAMKWSFLLSKASKLAGGLRARAGR